MFHVLAVAAAIVMQPVSLITPGGIQAIGPKQDDPRALCGPTAGQAGIVVQGGREAIGPKQDDPRKLAIGPKQDDPLSTSVLARPGDDNDPKASGGSGIVVQGGIEAIGPKQDDPRKLAIGPKQDDPISASVLARPGDDNDPKASGRSGIVVQGGIEAIGPKQDDPRTRVAIAARPGDDEDPHASAQACEVMQR